MSDLQWHPDLHERLARRAAALTRLTRAAAAAAVAAVAGWMLGLSPGQHALAVVAVAGVAAAWPLRHGLSAAFETIAHQAGLAYQTHVEHTGRNDPHGLLAAAAVQARLSIRGVTPPRQGAWWLPLAALALAVWLLASVVGGPGGWFASTPGASPEVGPGVPSPPPPPLVSEVESEPEAEADEVQPAEPSTGPPPPTPPDRGPGSGADDAVGDSDGEGLEREALERFLDSLRERPSLSEAELAAAEAERDGVRDDADADLESAELRSEEDVGELDDGQLVPSDRPADDATRDETAELPGGGDPTDPGGADEEQRPGESPDAADGDELPEPAGDEAVGEEGIEAGDDTMPQPEPNGAEAGAPGTTGEEPGLDAGDGEDAGIGAGPPVEGDDQVPDAAGELEALPGLIRPGPETLGGRVRLPGRDSELTLEGGDAARFERAVEQAVTDGSVPVTYQEIIRNYFR